MYDLSKKLFPINRSLTGNGNRETLKVLRGFIPEIVVKEVPTGTKCFDWTVPKEWNCKAAYIINPDGNRICDYQVNNLHLVGYSIPINMEISLKELNKHLHSLPELPDAIPYVTSYYQENWGFCIGHNERLQLKNGAYKVIIDSNLIDGSLTYGELLIKGESKEEVFLSTYICHPSMANNEISGPVVTTFLAKYIKSLSGRRYSYRIIFIQETIGSITYLSQNLSVMKERTVAGFNITCVGDNNNYSYLPSRYGNTVSDKAVKHLIKHSIHIFKEYSYLERGSDERQYCAPGVDLPICSVMRTKYNEYPEYHTSFDDLSFISEEGLSGALEVYKELIAILEGNYYYKTTILCEPKMGDRGLYPTMCTKNTMLDSRNMMNLLAYCDGNNDLIDIADIIGMPVSEIIDISEILHNNNLVTRNSKKY
jgi:aminopeptidase-like protein